MKYFAKIDIVDSIDVAIIEQTSFLAKCGIKILDMYRISYRCIHYNYIKRMIRGFVLVKRSCYIDTSLFIRAAILLVNSIDP